MYFDRLTPGQRKLNADNENRKTSALEALLASAGVDCIVSPDGGIATRRRAKIGESFPAKLGSSLAITGATNRWQYGWTEQWRTATGWEDMPGGRSGTNDTRFAINGIEANNVGTAVEGNGIDHGGGYPAGFSMQPAAPGAVVRMYEGADKDGNVAYDFEYENAEDGSCE